MTIDPTHHSMNSLSQYFTNRDNSYGNVNPNIAFQRDLDKLLKADGESISPSIMLPGSRTHSSLAEISDAVPTNAWFHFSQSAADNEIHPRSDQGSSTYRQYLVTMRISPTYFTALTRCIYLV
jgi:hypothetical protein